MHCRAYLLRWQGARLTCCRLPLLQFHDGIRSLSQCLESGLLKPRCPWPCYTAVEAEKQSNSSAALRHDRVVVDRC